MYIGSAFDFTLLKWLFLRLICPFHFKQLVTLLRSSSVRLDFLTYIFLWHSNEFVMTLLFFSRAPKNQIEFASAYQFVWRCKRDFYLTLKPELFRISLLQGRKWYFTTQQIRLPLWINCKRTTKFKEKPPWNSFFNKVSHGTLQRNGIQLNKSFYLHFAQALTKCQDFWRAAFCIGLSSGWIFFCAKSCGQNIK